MKSNIKFRMAARCEAAGRPNNEDNYQLDSDLSDNEWGFTADAEVKLGDKGALLVVCDGMGGMNAGEVASAIAVKTVKDCFSADKLTSKVLENPCAFLKEVIVQADSEIKSHSKKYPETEGMGSTIVIAWILGIKVYIGWCGDSRCYRFNSNTGLERLSHDHSYVQELVDAGKITEELAFDHPNNNIITRSLGDPRGAAKPDTKEFELYNNDIILLCSDGLCGTLRDNEIAEQIEKHQTSMQECRDALWEADKTAGWNDNVTIGLFQVISGCPEAVIPGLNTTSTATTEISTSKAKLIKANKRLKIILISIIAILVILIAGYFLITNIFKYDENLTNENVTCVDEDERNVEIQEEEGIQIKVYATQKEKKEIDSTNTTNVSENNIGKAAKGKDVVVKKQISVEVALEKDSAIEEKEQEVIINEKVTEEETIEEEIIEENNKEPENDSIAEKPNVTEDAIVEEVELEDITESEQKTEKQEKKIIENPHDNKDTLDIKKSITKL